MKGGDLYALFEKAFAEVPQTPAARACLEAASHWVPHVMLCANPYTMGTGQAYGCGQCLPCRINRKRVWAHRIMLEAGLYEDNAFVTLTYRDEDIPPGGTLVPKHAQLWLKRIRKAFDRPIRYYLVGEYGDETQRPHYHAALFGYPTCINGRSNFRGVSNRCCYWCDQISNTWGMGNIIAGTLEPHSAAYIAGYVTKKMTKADDERLDGRYPEFARMSLRPGIGFDAMHEVASALLEHYPDLADVPTSLRHGKEVKPLGRYLTRKLRAMTGREEKAPETTLQTMALELQDVLEIARQATSAPGMARFRKTVLKNLILDKYTGKRLSVEGKAKLFKSGKIL